MAKCGITRIDNILDGSAVPPITRSDGNSDAVGVVQELLSGHGFRQLPGIRDSLYGRFGPRTEECVSGFQQRCGLKVSGEVDRPTLEALVRTPAVDPLASRGYLTLVLDLAFGGTMKVMSVTTQFEGAGRFGAVNRNTDKAGLSFGLIQWAQKPLRLHELLDAFDRREHAGFVKIFGDGDENVTRGLLKHVSLQRGGTDPLGETLDPQFDLVREPWLGRFRESARQLAFHKIQVDLALAAFRKSFEMVATSAPELKSERAIAFMLDLANQHGDTGAESIYKKVKVQGASEAQALAAMQDESVRRIRAQHGDEIADATKSRREAFRTSPLLSDTPFNP